MELKHSFSAPTENRTDITFELNESGIFGKPSSLMSGGGKTTLGVSVKQKFSQGEDLFIVVPIDQVEIFCTELQEFTKKLKLLKNV